MTLKMQLRLEEAIQTWANISCEDNHDKIMWGSETIIHMTKAVVAVYDAVLESQIHAIREGYYRE